MSLGKERLTSVNCFGYVYCQLGLTEREEFMEVPPTVADIKRDFKPTTEESADAFIAVNGGFRGFWNNGNTIAHMVLAHETEFGLVQHRSKRWLAGSDDPEFAPQFRKVRIDTKDYAFERHREAGYNIVAIKLKK